MPEGPLPVRVELARSLDPARSAEVQDLLDEAQEADGFPGLSDEAHLGVEADPPPGALTLLARVGESGALAGVASLSERAGAWTVETVVRPDHRDDPRDVHSMLLDAALGEIAARGGGAVRAWLRTPSARQKGELAARGLEPERELLQLRAPLPPEAVRDASSPPVPVRPFRPGRDEEAWLELNARAFAGHPDQGSWTLADLERREHEPWFDPGGFLLHEEAGRLAAFCWTKVHRTPVLGEIYVIGVDPDFQGRGLGRALTRAGLGHLATRAVPAAMLYVESTNTPALVLYRSLGFSEHHREVQYRGEVAAR
ncbi:MAG: mycothiol synthase [Actinomycetota bacterium]|nr:mycothiol synthase [Actinomycetota bacterium]